MRALRTGCFIIAVLWTLLIGGCLYLNRSVSIERGLQLRSHTAGDFTYDAWSYGQWVTTRERGAFVATFSPPYDLIIAIRPHNGQIESIEIVTATVIESDGTRISILDKFDAVADDVERRPGAVITLPYAAFRVNELRDSIDPFTLEIEFKSSPSNDNSTIKQDLEIRGYEDVEYSFLFWDIISGV